ncbi:MAG: hypothetical protein WBF42_13540 [Terracidiphilus sp.]
MFPRSLTMLVTSMFRRRTATSPGPVFTPEDRQAISDVLDGLQAWNRYAVTVNKEHADLVFIVRTGRIVSLQGHAGIGSPQGQIGLPPQNRQSGQLPDGDSVGAGSEVGPPDDLLEVFATNADGKLIGPIWQREMKDGLDSPSVPLFRQLKAAVERAYPNPPAKKQP